VLNGIVLTDELHKDYHRLFGNNSTPETFIDFVKLLPKRGLNTNRAELVEDWIKFLDLEMQKQIIINKN